MNNDLWIAMADLEAFEKEFGPRPFYRVVEANARDQTVRIATGEWLRFLDVKYARGSYDSQKRRRCVMLQPVETWKPPEPDTTQ